MVRGKIKRFGLINVDYENNFKRSLKSSSSFYIKQIKKYSKSKSLQKQLKTTTGK